MTTETVTPEVLTKEIIISWPASVMLQKMKNPETRAEIERIFNEPEVDPNIEIEVQRVAEEAAAAQAASLAAEAETQRIAAEQAAVEAQMPAGGVEPPPMPPQLRGKEPNGLGEGAWGPRMDQPKSLNRNGAHLTNGARR